MIYESFMRTEVLSW